MYTTVRVRELQGMNDSMESVVVTDVGANEDTGSHSHGHGRGRRCGHGRGRVMGYGASGDGGQGDYDDSVGWYYLGRVQKWMLMHKNGET